MSEEAANGLLFVIAQYAAAANDGAPAPITKARLLIAKPHADNAATSIDLT
jgi:hypothetical protein